MVLCSFLCIGNSKGLDSMKYVMSGTIFNAYTVMHCISICLIYVRFIEQI